MKRALRFSLRVIASALGVSVLAIVIALVAIHTDWGRNVAREQVVKQLAGAFPGGVKIQRIAGSVFGTLEIYGVELDGRDRTPFVKIGEIDVRVGLWSLLSRTVHVQSLVIDDVAIDQHAQPPTTQEPEVEKAPGTPSPWTIELDHAEIHRASAKLATASRTLEFHDLEINASASLDRGAITAQLGVRGKWADRDIAATGLASYGGGIVSAPFFAAKVGGAHARLLGVRIGDVVEGVVAAFIPAVAAEAVAELHLPGDVAIVASASADGALDIHSDVAGATLRAVGQVSAQTKVANALVIADVPDGAKLDPRAAGKAYVTAAITAGFFGGGPRVRGFISVDATRPLDKQLLGKDAVTGNALIALDATPAGAWVMLETAFDVGDGHARATVELARDKQTGAVSITKSSLLATASRIGARNADAHVGYLFLSASGSGPLLPKPELKVTGELDGTALRWSTLSVDKVAARFDTRHVTEANAHLDVGGVKASARPIGSLMLDARATRGGDGTIDIAIDNHSIATAANGTWSGNGGHVRIEPSKITVDNFHTGSGAGTIVASAALDRATGNLRANVVAKDVALATLQPGMAGTAGATVAIDRRGGSWSGKVNAQGRGIVVEDQAPMDLDVALDLAGRHVGVTTTAVTPEGQATVAADLDGPYDLTDGAAWKRLERKALRRASIAIDHFDLGELARVTGGRHGASGTVSGKLEITATGASGDLALRGFATKEGIVDADLALSPDTRGPLGMLAEVKVQLEGVDAVTADAQLELPARPFDPAQWQALGKRALHHATATLAPLDFDPAVLARAHLDLPYRGHLEASFEVSEGIGSITANVDVTKLAGGAIVQPIDAHVQANAGDAGMHVTGSVNAGKQTLVTLDATAPITQAKLAVLRTLPIAGTLAIPKVPAEQIVAVLGRRDISRGIVDGEIVLGGTIGKPAAQLALTASHVSIPASIAGRPPAQLEWLQIAGQWDGTAGELAISGREANGGHLAVAASGRPDQLKQFVATVSATKFDIAPFAAFAVGALSAARGTLDASLSLQGLDPTTGQLDGHLDITNGRLPISALFGTLRSTNAHVEIANHEVKAKVDAKLGRGDLNGTATITLVGSTPSKATANLTLHKISLVRALQPTIDAELDANFTHDTAWHGDLSVRKGHVEIATTGGVALLASDAPSDIQFTDQAPSKLLPLLQRPPPAKPWLIADVHLLGTGFEIVQDEVSVRGNLGGTVKLSLGDGVGMDGTLEATTQNIELLGARAQLDHANVTWDGTLDPMLDVSVLRELTDLTITANVTGRLSKPQIALSSDSGSYTQGELIGYFLGGTPSADRSDVSQTAAAAGAGAASALVTSQLRKAAPEWAKNYASRVSLNYEVATAASSEALRVGYWISKHVFVAVHTHLEPLPDENANEGIGEWHFRDNMMLQGNAGDRGIAGLDLVRRWHW